MTLGASFYEEVKQMSVHCIDKVVVGLLILGSGLGSFCGANQTAHASEKNEASAGFGSDSQEHQPGDKSTNTTAEVVYSATGKRLDRYLTRLVPFGFAGVVLVAQNGQVALSKGYGWANQQMQVANTPETIFGLLSVSKQFTAAAVMTLEMQGRLHTSDLITKYFPDVPEDKLGITIHHLLTHTSGIVSGSSRYFENRSRDGIVRAAFSEPLAFSPGESFLYSNIGYALAATIVEKVSGESFDRYLQNHLFAPAGMSQTGLKNTRWNEAKIAHWYAEGKDRGIPTARAYPDWNRMGSGGVLTTAGDMYRWHCALLGDEILSTDAKNKMFTPHYVGNGYGYGWVIKETERGRRIRHFGASGRGMAAVFRRYVDADLTVIILSNRDGETLLADNNLRNIVDTIAFGEEVAAAPEVHVTEPGAWDQYAGVYRLSNGGSLRVDVEPGVLLVTANGDRSAVLLLGQETDTRRFARAPMRFVHVGKNRFVGFSIPTSQSTELRFMADPEKHMKAVILPDGFVATRED